VVRTGNVVHEGVAIVSTGVTTAVDTTVDITATVASIVITGASIFVMLEYVAGVRCLEVVNVRSRLRFMFGSVRRLAVRDERDISLRVGVVSYLGKKFV
jgi:hypothetical protein